MSRALTIVAVAQGLDLLTFAAALLAAGVPIAAESNPLYARAYLVGGIAVTAALKASFALALLALVARLNRHLTLGVVLAGGLGLLGAWSNVVTAFVWLQVNGK